MSLSEKRDRVRYYNGRGLRVPEALDVFQLTRHQYYHRPKVGADGSPCRPGRKATTHTIHHRAEGRVELHPNEKVVRTMKDIQMDDDLRCGYKRMKGQLELEGYQINAKKVYRLMRRHELLLYKALKNERPYVKQRCARPLIPLTLLEMDIKQVWVEEHRRYAFILTILDTFTRAVLFWDLAYSIRWEDVRRAWEEVIENHLQPANVLAKDLVIEVRSDNGPQFLAKKLQGFFRENHLCQVFTHPYTPQENGHVESFHAILQQAIKHDFFWTLEQLQVRLTVFYEKYNNERVHSAVAYLPPHIFWQAWEQGLVMRQVNKKRKVAFRLKVPRYRLLGILSPEGASRSDRVRLDVGLGQHKVVGAATC